MAKPNLDSPLYTHLLLIVVALFIGTGVWLVVQLTETSEITLNIPIRQVNVDTEVEIVSISPETVPVKFSFPATELSRMVPNNFWVEVDFSSMKDRIGRNLEDRGERTLSRERVRTNIARAEALNIDPLELLTSEVSWEARIRSIRGQIQPTIVGRPAANFLFDPDRVEIVGEEDIIVILTEAKERELQSLGIEVVQIPTEPIDIEGLDGFTRREVALQLPDGVSFLPGERRTTRTVAIQIIEESITRILQNVDISYEFIGSGEGLRAEVRPHTVDVVVNGRLRAVNALTKEMIKFNLYGVSENAGERREVAVETRIMDADLRSKVSIVEITPRVVEVLILEAERFPEVQPTPTPPVTATTPTIQVYEVQLLDGSSEQRRIFGDVLGALAGDFDVVNRDLGDKGAVFRVRTAASIQDLLTEIIASSDKFPFDVSYPFQTNRELQIRINEPIVETPIPAPNVQNAELPTTGTIVAPPITGAPVTTVAEDSPTS